MGRVLPTTRPIGDEIGMYAASRLASIASIPKLAKRLFVKAEFYRVTSEMRFAADFTICPSRTEPFGYVDVEFAWCAQPREVLGNPHLQMHDNLPF